MLDYRSIIVMHYGQGMSGRQIAEKLAASKSGVNDFLKMFRACPKLEFPLPVGITNDEISTIIYGHDPGRSLDLSYKYPDFEYVAEQMKRKHMTLGYQWNHYVQKCQASGDKPYQYRRFCGLYAEWRQDRCRTVHFDHPAGQSMEVDFVGRTYQLVDRDTGEVQDIIVFVAVLPFSQYIYAEGMLSTKEPQWIDVNNHALEYFGGVPVLVVPDNCKQAVLQNKDWIQPDVNTSYQEWAFHNGTYIAPTRTASPTWKPSVEGAVGILERGVLLDMTDIPFFSLEQFNKALWQRLEVLNNRPFAKKEHSRAYYHQEELEHLLPLPAEPFEYVESKTATVRGDCHVQFDNSYYSVDQKHAHKKVAVRATASKVRIYSMKGELLADWDRSTRKGKWLTNPAHMPIWYDEIANPSGARFQYHAAEIGPNTCEVVKATLASQHVEAQSYRLCYGILHYADKYTPEILEECCRRAVAAGRPNYTCIKTTITAVAAEFERKAAVRKERRDQGAFAMNADRSNLDKLLTKSARLASMRGETK